MQTTSQVTLDQFPNFINGNDVQLFVQKHGTMHLRNVQQHSSSRPMRAVRDRSIDRDADSRSRSAAPRRSQVRLTPGPHGTIDEEDDWGDWMQQGHRRQERLHHEDQRRPRSPAAPPGHHSTSSNSRSDNQPHMLYDSFRFVCALLRHFLAVMFSPFDPALR